jgi:archaellum component FlaC
MKEQVSIDNDIKYLRKYIDENWRPLADDALDNIEKECERLKRLHNNITQQIKGYKSVIALNSVTHSYSEEEIVTIDDKIKFLESLYDEPMD